MSPPLMRLLRVARLFSNAVFMGFSSRAMHAACLYVVPASGDAYCRHSAVMITFAQDGNARCPQRSGATRRLISGSGVRSPCPPNKATFRGEGSFVRGSEGLNRCKGSGRITT